MHAMWTAIKEPLQGKISLSRVFWLYGVLGSFLVMALGLAFDSSNELAMRLYTVFGLLFSIYVTVATYQCAGNCGSKLLAQFVRVSAVISLVLLPLFAYWELSGGLDLALSTLREEP
jgi:lipid-A-disaccharide synthase-like uncharacterized protein